MNATLYATLKGCTPLNLFDDFSRFASPHDVWLDDATGGVLEMRRSHWRAKLALSVVREEEGQFLKGNEAYLNLSFHRPK